MIAAVGRRDHRRRRPFQIVILEVTMIRRLSAVAALVLLAACEPTPPVVASYNGDSVSIQQSTLGAAEPNAAADAEATRICQQGGKRRAEYASTRTIADFTIEHLYLCLG